MVMALLAAHCIVQSADRVWHLPAALSALPCVSSFLGGCQLLGWMQDKRLCQCFVPDRAARFKAHTHTSGYRVKLSEGCLVGWCGGIPRPGVAW
jgi:hypothetical protein